MKTELKTLDADRVVDFVRETIGDDLHAMRILSVAYATLGVLTSGSLAIHAIGQGLAAARGTIDKHGVKQVDRLLSNDGIVVWDLFSLWVPHVLAGRKAAFVNLDWTEFDHDDQSTLVASVQTTHGRSTPLIWKTVQKSSLKGRRNAIEDEVMWRLYEVLPEGVEVTIVADRGFCDQKFLAFLNEELNFDYIIRIRGNILVKDTKGKQQAANEWVGKHGRMRTLRDVRITGDEARVPTFIATQDKDMDDIWCIVSSHRDMNGSTIKKHYGKRFSCEEFFRDLKDNRYGMGMSWTTISRPDRRDRLFLIAVLAHALLTLLGAAGESLGFDRMLKTSTRKRRQYSLFRQGLRWYALIPNMPEDRLRKLITRFVEMLNKHAVFRGVFGVI